MKKIVALTYAYFSLKKLPTPYLRTIMIFTGFVVLHFFILYEIFPIPKGLNPFGMNKIAIKNYISGGVFLGLIYLIVTLIFKKKGLEQYSFSEMEIKKYLRGMLFYFIIIFFVLILLSTLHLRDKW